MRRSYLVGLVVVLAVALAFTVGFLLRGTSSTTHVVVEQAPAPTTSTTVAAPTTGACALGRDPLGHCYDALGISGPRPPVNSSIDRAWYCAHPPDPDGINRSSSAGCSGQGAP